jgi:hypothetical protein
MSIEVNASVTTRGTPDAVFAEAAGKVENLARFFTGYGGVIPGIREARLEGDGVMRAGALRRVQLSDGSVIKERILRFEPPLVHAYDMAEMNTLQKLLCTNMESTWRFSPAEGGTRIDWHYRIDPRGLLVRPLCVVVAKLFERAMQRCLNHIAAAFRA